MRTNIYYDNYMLLEDYDNPYDDPDEEDEEYEVCPRCGGSGKIYLNDDYEEITKEMYNARSKNHRFAEKCEFCDGEGEVNY